MLILKNPKTNNQIQIPEKEAISVLGLNKKTINRLKSGKVSLLFLPISETVKLSNKAMSLQIIKSGEQKKKKKLPGICIIRMGGIGDLIMLSSGLAELKRRNPNTPITFATLPQHQEYIKSLPFVDNCITIDETRKYEFDKVIDLMFRVEPPELGSHCRGNWNDYTAKDRSDVFDEILEVYPAPKKFYINVDKKAEAKILSKINKNGRPIVAINAAMVAAARSLPTKYIKPLCKSIIQNTDLNIILFGKTQSWNRQIKDIKSNGRLINLIDQTDFKEMVALCKVSDLIVTPDTGTLHIAGALGTKTVALFGNINPRTRISYYPNIKPLYMHGAMSCLPCWDLHPCNAIGDPKNGVKCMRLLTPEIITEAIIKERKTICRE